MSPKVSRRLTWVLLLLVLALGLAVVITPIWIIMPFKPQTQRGLEISYVARRISPYVTVLASSSYLLLAIWLWRRSRWFLKVALIVLVIPLLGATWMARQNHFEWMFRPHASVAFAPANEVYYVGDSDMILAIENKGESVAYPVRIMAYHHVVQDTVGGTPVVATY